MGGSGGAWPDWPKVLKSASVEWGLCTEVFFPGAALSLVRGPRWEDRLVQALATLGVGLLAASVAPCPRAWRPQVQRAGDTWVHGHGMLKGNAVCVHSGPARDQDMGHGTWDMGHGTWDT